MRAALKVLREVARQIERHGMSGPAVAAVSGGADSVCLLHVLHELGLAPIVAHLDHGIRPEAGDDAAFVRELARRLGLECVVERRDVPAYRGAHKLSLEAAAREVRHAFLREVAARRGAGAIFLGHTADDQVETLLLRLIRGAGPAGLSGMRPKDGLLCRPMLTVPRADVLDYLADRRLAWREDASNRDQAFLRNRVRHELLPLLATMNPGIKQVLLREAELLAGRQQDVEAELLRQLGLGGRQIERALDGQAVVLRGGRRLRITQPPAARCERFDVALPAPGEVHVGGVGTIRASRDGEGQPIDAGCIRGELRVRNRRPGDWFMPLGMRRHKKLQDFLVDEHIPEAERDRIPLVVDVDTIVWVAGMRIDERYKVTSNTTAIMRLQLVPR